jgi:SOS response regulatory protein OraA/RecX
MHIIDLSASKQFLEKLTKTTKTFSTTKNNGVNKALISIPKKPENITIEPKTYQDCRSFVLSLIAKKDYSTEAIRQKCLQKEFQNTDITKVIKEFIDSKWLDDERFACNIIEFYKGQKGLSWIAQKLTLKQIPKDIVTKLLAQTESIKPKPSIKELLARKHKITNWQSIDIKVKNKVLYFLSSRGFSNPFGILKDWQEEKF